jgi:hypothetical protein
VVVVTVPAEASVLKAVEIELVASWCFSAAVT